MQSTDQSCCVNNFVLQNLVFSIDFPLIRALIPLRYTCMSYLINIQRIIVNAIELIMHMVRVTREEIITGRFV